MNTKSLILKLDSNDNVALACENLPKGTLITNDFVKLVIRDNIPFGHKVALSQIEKGYPVIKYNTIIGYAKDDIKTGHHVHTHNILFDSSRQDYAISQNYFPTKLLPLQERRTFLGYVRNKGTVGTRNLIAIPIMSNCAASVARKIASHFTPEVLAAYPNVDGVVPLITTLGCGMSGSGKSMEYLRRVLAGHIKNANFAASLVCALGCERNNIYDFFETEQLTEGPLLKKLVIQENGGSHASVESGIQLINGMLPIVNQFKREKTSVEHLKVALQCGGSDSFSCMSANPALGKAMDLLVKNGGTAVLSETTELFGAEHTLTSRAKNPEVANRLLRSIEWWKDYCKGYDVQINGNVTPGNTKGGLSNIIEKALGSVKKGGSTSLNAFYSYAEPICEKGLVIMDAPSYDPVSATAQFAGGCNICVFTTGQGSCYGSRYLPTIKIASNSELYHQMYNDMDINAGLILDGETELEELGAEILNAIVRVASGEKTKSELFGMCDEEFIPWAIGITS